MSDQNERDTLHRLHGQLHIIWVAMLISLLVYGVVCFLWGDRIAKQPLLDSEIVTVMRPILYAFSVIGLVLSFSIRRFLPRFWTGHGGTVTSYDAPAPSAAKSAQKYQAMILVSLVLAEGIGLFGLILFFLTGDTRELYRFLMVSAVALLMLRPRTEEFEGMIRGARTNH